MSRYEIDVSRYPIVILAAEGDLSDVHVDALIAEATRVLNRGDKIVVIQDASRIGKVSAYVRRRSAQWQREQRALMAQNCIGTVYVLSSPLLRFIAMTILMVTNLPMPYRVCETREEALRWSEARLREYGNSIAQP